ncbi:unnamed protein product [Musa acuminata subsp. burmannicoides]
MEAPAVNYSRHASPTSIHPSMHLFFLLPLPPTNTCYQIYKSLNFTLMQDEYLTSVSGYVKYDCSEFPCVSQLTFTTNLGKTYGPYGGGGGTFFEVNVEYDEIKGFFGQATTEYLTAFGVYKTTFQLVLYEVYLYMMKEKISLTEQRDFLMQLRKSLYYHAPGKIELISILDRCNKNSLWARGFVSEYIVFPCYCRRNKEISDLELMKPVDIRNDPSRLFYLTLLRRKPNLNIRYDVDVSNRRWHPHSSSHTKRWIVSTLHEGLLSQQHVDSKYSEMLGSCISKEAFDVVIFYFYFEKGSTPTSIWTICPSKIGAKHELRYARKVRTDVFDIPRNGGEVFILHEIHRLMLERHAWNSSPSEPPYLGVTRVVPSISEVILMEFTHEAAPTLMPMILSAGSMPQRDSLSHGHLRKPHPRACAAVLITFEACTTMHPSQTK